MRNFEVKVNYLGAQRAIPVRASRRVDAALLAALDMARSVHWEDGMSFECDLEMPDGTTGKVRLGADISLTMPAAVRGGFSIGGDVVDDEEG